MTERRAKSFAIAGVCLGFVLAGAAVRGAAGHQEPDGDRDRGEEHDRHHREGHPETDATARLIHRGYAVNGHASETSDR